MDQLKDALQVVMKYRFWLICAVITLVPVGGWFTTTSRLKTEFDDRKSAIDGKFSSGTSIKGISNHPNPFHHAGMDSYIAGLTNEVQDAWMQQYQRQEGILVWPSELGDDFIQEVDTFRPLESLPFSHSAPFGTPREDEIPRRFRERYRDYIKDELPKLAEIIGADWQAQKGAAGMGMGMMSGGDMGYGDMGYGDTGYGEGDEYSDMGMMSGGGGYPGGPGMMARGKDEDPIIVMWSGSDQSSLQNRRFDWSGNQDKAPRTVDVLYSQEDLWVLNALMQIIARTNRGATANYNATIKQISYISLGRAVGRSTGMVQRGRSASGMGGPMGMEGSGYGYGSEQEEGYEDDYGSEMSGDIGSGMSDMSGMSGMSGAPGVPGAVGATSPGVAMDPAHMRYVDTDYAPIPADTLREALSPENKNPEYAYLVVAKRIPVRMGLVMDQRKVHRLVAECGNSSLMVEIRQVRVNKRGGASGASMGMMGGMMSGMGGMDSGGMSSMGGFGGGYEGGGEESSDYDEYGGSDYGGFGGMESGYSGSMGGGMGTTSGKATYDLPVEVYGMVYIYNPVDMAKIGVEQKAAEGEVLPADVPPEPVATAPATGA